MNSSTSPTASIINQRFRHFPNNFVLSGQASSTDISGLGELGALWLATAFNNDNAYNFYTSDQFVFPGTSGSRKFIGRTVRCIASSIYICAAYDVEFTPRYINVSDNYAHRYGYAVRCLFSEQLHFVQERQLQIYEH